MDSRNLHTSNVHQLGGVINGVFKRAGRVRNNPEDVFSIWQSEFIERLQRIILIAERDTDPLESIVWRLELLLDEVKEMAKKSDTNRQIVKSGVEFVK